MTPQSIHGLSYPSLLDTVTVPDASDGFYQQTALQIHPDKSHIYAVDTGLSPATFHRFNTVGGTFEAPYPGKPTTPAHIVFGALRIHPAGTTMYSASGNVFQTTNAQSSDMTWSGDLWMRWRDLAFRPDGKIAYLVPEQDPLKMDGVYPPLVHVVDTDSLQIVTTYNLSAPAARVLAGEAGLLFLRGTLGGNPKTEIEVVPYSAL